MEKINLQIIIRITKYSSWLFIQELKFVLISRRLWLLTVDKWLSHRLQIWDRTRATLVTKLRAYSHIQRLISKRARASYFYCIQNSFLNEAFLGRWWRRHFYRNPSLLNTYRFLPSVAITWHAALPTFYASERPIFDLLRLLIIMLFVDNTCDTRDVQETETIYVLNLISKYGESYPALLQQ